METKGEIRIASYLFERGYEVCVPLGKLSYDLVVIRDKKFFRIQVKDVPLKNGALYINLLQSNGTASGIKKKMYKEGAFDILGVWVKNTNNIFFIPANEVIGRKGLTIRLLPTRNGQKKGIRYADKYKVFPA